jgi:hypothetical protein
VKASSWRPEALQPANRKGLAADQALLLATSKRTPKNIYIQHNVHRPEVNPLPWRLIGRIRTSVPAFTSHEVVVSTKEHMSAADD